MGHFQWVSRVRGKQKLFYFWPKHHEHDIKMKLKILLLFYYYKEIHVH